MDMLKKLFTIDLLNNSIASLSIYFKNQDFLFYIDSDSLIACIQGLNSESEAYDILEKITISEGLFIK